MPEVTRNRTGSRGVGPSMLRFLLLTFAITWPAHLLARQLEGPGGLALFALGGFAPLIAVLVVTRGEVWREAHRSRPPLWALAVGFGGVSMMGLVAGLLGGGLMFGPPMILATLLPPIAEEFGWRGYLQPRLTARLGGLGGSVAVGAVWALWHTSTAEDWSAYPLFALSIVLHSILIGWLWQRGGSSTWIAVAAHAGINLRVVDAPHGPYMAVLGVLAALAAVGLVRRGGPHARR